MNRMDNPRVLIVDDEIQSRSLVRKLLSVHFPGMAVDDAETVSAAMEKINTFNPQLVFLDVQMRGETGFDLLEQIGSIPFAIIFTTAHSEFAVKAFRYSAMDYLMKPLDTDEFKTAVEKTLRRLASDQSSSGQIEYLKQIKSEKKIPDRLTIPTAEGFLFVAINEILYCQAVGNYTEFRLAGNRKILSSYTLGYYDELLSDHNFFRVHRSYLINLAHIKMYKKSGGGSVLMNDGEEIEISRGNREAFLKLFKG